MNNLTVVIPFWHGHKTIDRLLRTIPELLPVIIVNDHGSESPHVNRKNTQVINLEQRGYFSGACNTGFDACNTDVLVLNQDVWFENDIWLRELHKAQDRRLGTYGDGVMKHPAWRNGYVQGTFMYISRDALEKIGGFDADLYPLWGATCEWQVRACRAGFTAKPVHNVPGLKHEQRKKRRFGDAITRALKQEPGKRREFIRTPPEVSVVIPCYNYGHYLPEAVNSILAQTFQSFEIVIVNDASTDDSAEVCNSLADPWKGIRVVHHRSNGGTAVTLNTGVANAYGTYFDILSADDWRKPYHLQTMYDAVTKLKRGYVYGDIYIWNGHKEQYKKLLDYDFEELIHKNHVPAGIMCPVEAWRDVGGYPTIMHDGREDWAFAVALGRSGWCGVNIGDAGNVYRREKQNRSYQTRARGRSYYLQKLQQLFPDIYGGIRPMGCCGGGRRSQRALTAAREVAPLVGAEGMVVVEYIGPNIGGDTMWMPNAKPLYQSYKFGSIKKRGYIDARHLNWFLNVRDGGKRLFRQIAPQKTVEKQPVQEPAVEVQEIESAVQELESEDSGSNGAVKITDLDGVGKTTAQRLVDAGFVTVDDLAKAQPLQLVGIKGISTSKAEQIVWSAQQYA